MPAASFLTQPSLTKLPPLAAQGSLQAARRPAVTPTSEPPFTHTLRAARDDASGAPTAQRRAADATNRAQSSQPGHARARPAQSSITAETKKKRDDAPADRDTNSGGTAADESTARNEARDAATDSSTPSSVDEQRSAADGDHADHADGTDNVKRDDAQRESIDSQQRAPDAQVEAASADAPVQSGAFSQSDAPAKDGAQASDKASTATGEAPERPSDGLQPSQAPGAASTPAKAPATQEKQRPVAQTASAQAETAQAPASSAPEQAPTNDHATDNAPAASDDAQAKQQSALDAQAAESLPSPATLDLQDKAVKSDEGETAREEKHTRAQSLQRAAHQVAAVDKSDIRDGADAAPEDRDASDKQADADSPQRSHQKNDSQQGSQPAPLAPDIATKHGAQSPTLAVRLASANTPAQTYTEQQVNEQQTVSLMSRGLQAALAQKGGTLTLRLNPPTLGSMRIDVQMQQGALTASIEASTAAAHDVLTKNIETLRQALESRGIDVQRVETKLAPAALNTHTSTHNEQQGANRFGADHNDANGDTDRQMGDAPDEQSNQDADHGAMRHGGARSAGASLDDRGFIVDRFGDQLRLTLSAVA